MKFALFVEGPTERAVASFLKRWLDPKLSRPVRIAPVRFQGSGDYRRKFVHRAKLDLHSGNLIGVIGLLDFYGSGIDYPPGLSVDEKYNRAKRRMEAEVGDGRFCQHFAVHESEAWLLSDPRMFPPEIQRSLSGTVAQPEGVDFDEPPSKLLARLYSLKLGKSYKKVSDGADLFGRLDAELAFDRCPHLRLLLEDVLRLAGAAGL